MKSKIKKMVAKAILNTFWAVSMVMLLPIFGPLFILDWAHRQVYGRSLEITL